jgi:hypothetical protein
VVDLFWSDRSSLSIFHSKASARSDHAYSQLTYLVLAAKSRQNVRA